MKYIICVGAVYIDTILGIPHFPIEDEKIRAKSMMRRRGGNCANTLEVLEQLVEVDSRQRNAKDEACLNARLCLLAVLPNKHSDDVNFIRDSIKSTRIDPFCIYREQISTAASSLILRNEETGTRTIISHTSLPEMNFEEFSSRFGALYMAEEANTLDIWIHFEGRNEPISNQCIEHLRDFHNRNRVRVSVELEKPSRPEMFEGAKLADIIFYSSIWAKAKNHNDPVEFLKTQTQYMRPDATLICMWGSEGAVAVRKHENSDDEWERIGAWKPSLAGDDETMSSVVDTVGAGDTFIAGILYAFSHHERTWGFRKKLEFAAELAGRKVFQDGFQGLGSIMDQSMGTPSTSWLSK